MRLASLALAAGISVVAPSIAFSGIEGVNEFSSLEEQAEIAQGCIELRSLGDVRELSANIERYMGEIRVLMADDDIPVEQSEIVAIAAKLTANYETMISIIESRFMELKYTQKILWRLEDKEMDRSRIKETKAFAATSFAGQNAGDLVKQIRFETNSDDHTVYATLERKASLVELCQLQQAMLISARVYYFYKGKRSDPRSLRFRLVASPLIQP
ncbi:MAG: hypothetical protein V4692_00920 [Bdellovibrionota bacterium]